MVLFDRRKRVTIIGLQTRSAGGGSHYTGGFARAKQEAVIPELTSSMKSGTAMYFPKTSDLLGQIKIDSKIISRSILEEK